MKTITLMLVLVVLCSELAEAWVVRNTRIRIGKKRSAQKLQRDTEENKKLVVLDVENQAVADSTKVALTQVCPQLDLNDDVTPDNVQQAFAQADADKNGVLDKKELKVFATLAAVAEACQGYKQDPPQ